MSPSVAPISITPITSNFLEKDQIEAIVKEAIHASETQKTKKSSYVLIFGSLLTLMSLAVVGTSYATLKLTKDLAVDPSNGSLIGSDGMVVATQTAGMTVQGHLNYDERNNKQFMCLALDEIVTLWDTVSTGGNAALLAQGDSGEEILLPMQQSGTKVNSTHVCFGGPGNIEYCADLDTSVSMESCGGGSSDSGDDRRLRNKNRFIRGLEGKVASTRQTLPGTRKLTRGSLKVFLENVI